MYGNLGLRGIPSAKVCGVVNKYVGEMVCTRTLLVVAAWYEISFDSKIGRRALTKVLVSILAPYIKAHNDQR